MSKISIYTTSLIASFMIGLDCFVIGFIFLYPFLGLIPAIVIASGGWVLNTFVYYMDGPENIKELLESKEKRSITSWLINLIAFLGALFVLLFTIYAYLSLSVAIPALGMWITPFLIATMAVAYFIGTFTLNKSELTKDLLSSDQSWFTSFRNAILKRLEFRKKKQSHIRFFWLLFARVIAPLLVALIVSFSLTYCFYNGCAILLVGCGLPYLAPLLVLLAMAYFIAELYFNAKQNIALVDKAFEHSKDQKNNQSLSFTPGMICMFMMVLANAIANGFIAMDAATIAIGAIALIKFITGAVQSFCTMLNCCCEFVMNEEKSFDALNGHETKTVLAESAVVLTCLLGLYCLSVFSPAGLFMICPVIMTLMIFKYQHGNNFGAAGDEITNTKNNGDNTHVAWAKTIPKQLNPERGLQNGSSLPDRNGGLNS